MSVETLVQHCTVKLSLPGQRGWGTGFFVAPGWILTCAHVVRQAADRPVTVFYQEQYLSAMVNKIADDGKTLDLALIELELSKPLLNHPCVLLDLHKEPVANGEKLYAYGYLRSYPHAAPVRLVNEGLTGDQPPLLKLKQAQIEPGISGAALLNLRSRKVCGMVKETRNANFDLGGGAIPTRVILEQFPQLREGQQAFHERDKRWLNLLAPQANIDFQPYLKSIRDDEYYQEGQEVYTPTTLEDRQPVRGRETARPSQRRFSSRLKLRVETVKRDQQGQEYPPDESPQEKERVEQWDVLEGLRQYATDHVVLIGKPGSGKSTSMERLLWEEAERALHDAKARIPVLLKLRNCRSSIEQLIRDFLIGHQVTLERQDIEELLRQGKFLLLLDGLNELPESFRTEIKNFRDRYHRTTAMIVSTRDLSLGGTLGIDKTLRMLPLTEGQMREFVRGYLGEEGDRLFQQLQGDRLRKFAETPLLLWMLCRVFAQSGQVPRNLGLAFREFAQLHDQEIQAYAPVESREQWPKLLRHLAFVMMQGETPTDLRLSIPREEAENCLTEYLRQAGWANPRGCAEGWLKDLLKYHLVQRVIQPNLEEHLEFRHQLIEEYYAAEELLQRLPHLSDEELTRDYLNYLKWTEPVALMLALLDKEDLALRVVRLAMDEVDLILGARLAGDVQPTFQSTSVGWIDEKELPLKLKVQCWEASHSEQGIEKLLTALKDSDEDVRRRSAWALGKIGSERAVEALLDALKDSDQLLVRIVAEALGQIGSEQAVGGLLDTLQNPYVYTRRSAVEALRKIGGEQAVEGLRTASQHSEYNDVRRRAAEAFGKNDSEQAAHELPVSLQVSSYTPRNPTLEKMRSKQVEKAVQRVLDDLKNSNVEVRRNAADALAEIGSKLAVEALLDALVEALLDALKDSDEDVRRRVAEALGEIGSRQEAWGQTGSEKVVEALLDALKDSEKSVQRSAAEALGQIGIGSEETIKGLCTVLKNSDSLMVSSVAVALGEIGDARPLSDLWQFYSQRVDVYLWNAITRIQNRCQFYNYELWKEAQLQENFPRYNERECATQTTTVFNIETLNGAGAAINLGGTVKGNQTGSQPP